MAWVRGGGREREHNLSISGPACILPPQIALPSSPLWVAPHGGKLQLVTSSGVIAKSWFLEQNNLMLIFSQRRTVYMCKVVYVLVCVCMCACAQMFVRVGVAITQTKFKLNCAASLVEEIFTPNLPKSSSYAMSSFRMSSFFAHHRPQISFLSLAEIQRDPLNFLRQIHPQNVTLIFCSQQTLPSIFLFFPSSYHLGSHFLSYFSFYVYCDVFSFLYDTLLNKQQRGDGRNNKILSNIFDRYFFPYQSIKNLAIGNSVVGNVQSKLHRYDPQYQKFNSAKVCAPCSFPKFRGAYGQSFYIRLNHVKLLMLNHC